MAFTPGSPGGDPVLHYDASCPGGGPTGTGTGSSSPITVTGLSNGVAYTCTVSATNVDGTGPNSTASSLFIPEPVPDAPTALTVAPASTQVTVGFTPGAANGGTITGYSATCTPVSAGTPGTATNTASPVVVTGLTNGDAYTCTVFATNAYGPSFVSAPSSAVTPGTVPAAPTSVVATGGNGSASVAFIAGANNGNAVLHFDASCTGTGPPIAGTAASSPISVPGLTNGVSYTCAVTATNAVGTSAAGTSNAFTPATVPAAPTTVIATAANLSATITFTAGANNGSPITAFNASCTGAGPTGTGTAAASPIHVTGLANGDAYTCAVTAVNTIGISAAGTSNAIVPAVSVPDPPTAVVATQPGPPPIVATTWSVAFTPPANDGGAAGGITSYTALCISSNGGLPGTPTTGTASPIVVTGLTVGNTLHRAP